MIAVIFEVDVPADAKGEYLDWAAELRPLLSEIDGFLSIERFQSLTTPGRLLSLSFWRDEAAVARWRALPEHRRAQVAGRDHPRQRHPGGRFGRPEQRHGVQDPPAGQLRRVRAEQQAQYRGARRDGGDQRGGHGKKPYNTRCITCTLRL